MLLGNAVLIQINVVNTSGAAADPATLVLTVKKPDQTSDTFNIGQLTHGSTGSYSYVYTPSQSGLHEWTAVATVPAYSTGGEFNVESGVAALVNLADVKAQLNISDTTSDAELGTFIDAASAMIQKHPDFGTGPIVPTTYTESHDGGDETLYVRHAPLLSVTSLTEYYGTTAYTLSLQPLGSSVDAYGFSIDDARAGRIVRRTINGSVYCFPPGVGNIIVTYIAGQSSVTADVRQATLLLVSHLWETQQSGRTIGKGQNNNPGMAYTLPNRVIEALQGAKRGPAFA